MLLCFLLLQGQVNGRWWSLLFDFAGLTFRHTANVISHVFFASQFLQLLSDII